jgi:hypothetical protein
MKIATSTPAHTSPVVLLHYQYNCYNGYTREARYVNCKGADKGANRHTEGGDCKKHSALASLDKPIQSYIIVYN